MVSAYQQVSSQWWDEHSAKYSLYASELVRQEVAAGDAEAATRRLEIVDALPSIRIDKTAVELAKQLVAEGPIPEPASADALHIALAASNGIDFLLTWNFRHLANATLRSRIESAVERSGFACPVICTPEQLLEE